jgi:hypothetical protein
MTTKPKLNKERMEECKATHEEVCDQALAHYQKLSMETSEWNSVIPKAIFFYKNWGEKDIVSAIEWILQSRIKEIEKDWHSYYGTPQELLDDIKRELDK